MYLTKVSQIKAPGSSGVLRMVVLLLAFLAVAAMIALVVTRAQHTALQSLAPSAALSAAAAESPLQRVSYQQSLPDMITQDVVDGLGLDPSLAALAGGLITGRDLIECDSAVGGADIARSEALGQSLAGTLGLSASPMFGFLAVNVVKRARCGWILEDEGLPWFMKNEIFYALCAAALLVLFKDLLLGWVPMLKAPIDGLEQILKVALAVITIPTIATLFTATASGGLLDVSTAQSGMRVGPSTMPAITASLEAGPAGQSLSLVGARAGGGYSVVKASPQKMPQAQSPDITRLAEPGAGGRFWLNFLLAAGGLFATLVMWVSAGFIGGLVMLAPIPLFDSLLRSVRGGLIIGLMALAVLAPVIALIAGLVVFAFALWLFPWAFRLMSFGVMNAADFLPFRLGAGNGARRWDRAFSGQGLRELPRRTAGRLVADAQSGALVFSYSPFFILPRRAVRIDDKAVLTLVEGILMPSLRLGFSGTGPAAFLLPARYRKRGSELAVRLGLAYSEKQLDGTVSVKMAR
ncbi:hypothetical protein [Aquisalinus flavus]|uniref:Uncharacterized protein n=1 Tax=Aquisalinus flavus TaxID=1526572 RepID=A0A8J2V4B2_9PROT|nr:hypothetical protein [Aquisalinus flavus]MBD0427104.1 hypothetical protein [Aquisalinus flavus]UNE46926.1 hypothetical protein FF099_02070 [Aquisalinus flavus]GGC98426.1 hypothetical protein GCM10011342_04180 [Aquisalinus flavus]